MLVSLAVPRDRPLRQSAKVRTQSEAVKGLKASDGKAEPREPAVAPRAALREIDLDGDGVTDVLQFETPMYVGEISVDVVYRRVWFLNINGQWFPAGEWQDQDCT